MKKFFNTSFCVLFLYTTTLLSNALAPALSPSSMKPQISQQYPAQQHQSVHDIFKDVPQDELLAMMEEGQRFIQDLEENGTPEEKMLFAQAMQEALQNFTEDDWKEFEAIVDAVQDKLPPFEIPVKEEEKTEKVIDNPIKKSESKTVDNSLEKILHAIHKAINAILLKAKSDKFLMERITIQWDNKDNLNELVRLLQVINKKELIDKIIEDKSKDEDTKLLYDSIENFNKRLQLENDQFVIADTFGLATDEKTTQANLKKLNKIIQFFDDALSSLLPKVQKFLEKYEPQALQKAKEHDQKAKAALENAKKIEKTKRPNGNSAYQAKGSLNGSKKLDANLNGTHSERTPSRMVEHPGHYLDDIHKENIKAIKSKTNPQDKTDNKNDSKDNKKQEKSAYDKIAHSINDYLESFSNSDLVIFTQSLQETKDNVFKEFKGTITQQDKQRVKILHKTRQASQELSPIDAKFLDQFNEKITKAKAELPKNIKLAYAHYEQSKEVCEKLYPMIDAMLQTLQSIKGGLDQMTSKELDQLQNSTSFKNLEHRINSYYDQFKTIQGQLKDLHKNHNIEDEFDPGFDKVTSMYDDLITRIKDFHGIERKIVDIKSQFTTLQKSIKASIGRKKREENKAALQAE